MDKFTKHPALFRAEDLHRIYSTDNFHHGSMTQVFQTDTRRH